jgi:hypothetical protein
MTDLSMRTPTPPQGDAADLAHAIRSRIDMILQEGSVWGDGLTGVLRVLRGTSAWHVFGEAAITAAATKTAPACCAFGFCKLLAVRLHEPPPQVSPALITLLGRPCQACLTEIAAERRPTNDAAGRRDLAPRPAVSTTALIAGAPPFRAGGPSSPDGWTVRVTRTPTPAEDRAFLRSMFRQDAARRRR